jgi:DNA-binding NtrC family response regulator/tetratricopeptide (TPR) repeat protein
MSPNLFTLQQLHKTGRFAEFLAATSLTRQPSEDSPPELRVMLAEALVLTGDIEAARNVARAEPPGRGSPSVRARCEVVLGLAEKKSGEFEAAMRHLHAAVKLAEELKDPRQLAWCELHRFRLLIEGYRDAQSAAVSRVRRAVVDAGDPHLTALLHDSVAIMEGEAGRFDEARRHLEIAQSVLSRHPHAWIELSVRTGGFCVDWLECDYIGARSHLTKAREAATLVGGAKTTATIDVNQGHLDLVTGNFGAASAVFDRLMSDARSPIQMGAYDGLARLFLALNHRSKCVGLVTQFAERTDNGFDFYPLRWLRACGICLSVRAGRFDDAIALAERELSKALELRDRRLATHLLLLQADALARAGKQALSAAKLGQAVELGVTSAREQQGHYYAMAARVLQSAQAPYGLLAARAKRLWQRERNIWAPLMVADLGTTEIPIRRVTQSDVDRFVPLPTDRGNIDPSQSTAFLLLNSVTAAFELAHDPALVAAELSLVRKIVNCSARFAIETTVRSQVAASGSLGSATLATDHRGALTVSCDSSQDPTETLAASNLLSLVRRIDEVVRFRREERNRAALWPSTEEIESDNLFLSGEMVALAATARKIAATSVPVLITGETGTGKEVLARAIHAASTRAKATFLPFNCSAGPRDMIDAQLFGHRRGAFTGATEHAPGVVRAAAGGTLFLDEIGEAPLDVQPKLLRFLEAGEIHPVGEPQPTKVDVRIIAATNIDLDAAVSAGRFREDLFYRLNIIRLHLPPLRERRVEIPALAQHYLRKHARELGKGDLRLAEETMEYLLLFRWPGNVRQLANEMRRLAVLAETDAVLMPEHLSSEIVASRRTVPASERTLDGNELVVRLDQPLAAATEHLERAIIPYALKQCGGRVEDAARMLGLSRKGLYLKRLRLRLEIPEQQARTA